MTTLTATKTDDGVKIESGYPRAAMVWAVTRIALGWLFLWTFLDKTLALGFPTGRGSAGGVDYLGDDAWISGGSPTDRFLSTQTEGPVGDLFEGLAGAVWVDWLFMVGLLGVGVALVLGIGMRIAAAAGATMLVLMWAATLPPETNPLLDERLIYTLVLVGLALSDAGRRWGLGRWWQSTGLVHRFPVLK